MKSQADEVVTCSTFQHNGRLERYKEKYSAAMGIAVLHRNLLNLGSDLLAMPLAVWKDQEFGREQFVISREKWNYALL